MRRVFGMLVLAYAFLATGAVHAGDNPSYPVAASIDPGLTVKWRMAQRRIADDEARLGACRAEIWTCSNDEMRFEAIVAAGRVRDGRGRIGEINRAVNLAIRPVSDERRFGIADRWSSPLETIGDGAGDCEDYAIVKLLALRQAGVASHDLKLLIVRDPATRSDHAVVAARLDGRWLLLDNRRFALVDLEFTQYRLLAELDSGAENVRHAAADAASSGAPATDAARDIM
jgi:predicted transglutaminase-like cysteine proteinase